jgi:transcriptional regulator with XRE-family HTH domain
MELMKIGTQVRWTRERALLTQGELANRAGIGLTTLNRIENDHADPQFRTIRKIAKALDVNPRDLIGDDDE